VSEKCEKEISYVCSNTLSTWSLEAQSRVWEYVSFSMWMRNVNKEYHIFILTPYRLWASKLKVDRYSHAIIHTHPTIYSTFIGCQNVICIFPHPIDFEPRSSRSIGIHTLLYTHTLLYVHICRVSEWPRHCFAWCILKRYYLHAVIHTHPIIYSTFVGCQNVLDTPSHDITHAFSHPIIYAHSYLHLYTHTLLHAYTYVGYQNVLDTPSHVNICVFSHPIT